jgi:hypothetical protein
VVTGWTAIIGIPEPPFGVGEMHTVYAGKDWDEGGGPRAYQDAGNGPFTHYVDNTSPGATDVGNPWGTPDRPRLTIPATVPAGGVVEVHGGPYTDTVGGVLLLGGTGTPGRPVFIRGASPALRPTLAKPVVISGRYVIVENLVVDGWSTANDSGIEFGAGAEHVAVRYCEVQHGPNATTAGIAVGDAQDIVIYASRIHDNGDWHADYDQDHHGIAVSSNVRRLWVVGNELYHNSGDGIQINGDNATTQYIYVGRNTAWENKQTGFWCKYASDVIFSQNTAHDHVPSGSSGGAGMGWQYGPDRIWFIGNHSYDNTVGISGPSADSSGAPAYIVGNVINDCTEKGIDIWGNRTVYVVNNTIVRTGYGISISGSDGLVAVNNIIADMTARDYFHQDIDGGTVDQSAVQYNLCSQNGGAVCIDWGWDTCYDVAGFEAAVKAPRAVGNLEGDPQFAGSGGDGFQVQTTSLAVDHGTGAGYAEQVYGEFLSRYGLSIAVDFDGTPRPVGNGYDIGAFER